MARRKRMARRKDIGVFKATYNKTKKINHSSAMNVTGTRL